MQRPISLELLQRSVLERRVAAVADVRLDVLRGHGLDRVADDDRVQDDIVQPQSVQLPLHPAVPTQPLAISFFTNALYRFIQHTHACTHTHTHTHTFNGHLSRTTWVSRYLKGKTNLDFTKARDSEWQWHQLGYMQVCTSLQTDNHTSTPPLSFLQIGCPSCRPTNSAKALKATTGLYKHYINHNQTLFTLTFRSLPETFVKRRCTILLPVLATVVM